MAKTGFPFYRAETDRFQDIRIKRLKKEFKGAGYAVYSYILNEIRVRHNILVRIEIVEQVAGRRFIPFL